jgi:hypothetical protein
LQNGNLAEEQLADRVKQSCSVNQTLIRNHSNFRLFSPQNVTYRRSVKDCFPEEKPVSAFPVAYWPDDIGNSGRNLILDVNPPVADGSRVAEISCSSKEHITGITLEVDGLTDRRRR